MLIVGSLIFGVTLFLAINKQLAKFKPQNFNAFDEMLWSDVGGKAGGSGI